MYVLYVCIIFDSKKHSVYIYHCILCSNNLKLSVYRLFRVWFGDRTAGKQEEKKHI